MTGKDASLSIVVGRRGTGKSTRVKAIMGGLDRVIVFDPQAEYQAGGFCKFATTGEALRVHVAQDWARGFRIAYIPAAGSEKECLHALAEWILAIQTPYRDGADDRQLTLVVEEMDLSFPVQELPAHLNGMYRICNQGRHYGVNVIGATQFPAQVSKRFRANVAEAYLFALGDPDHRAAAARMIAGPDDDRGALERQLSALPDHHYLHWAGGVVKAGQNSLKS